MFAPSQILNLTDAIGHKLLPYVCIGLDPSKSHRRINPTYVRRDIPNSNNLAYKTHPAKCDNVTFFRLLRLRNYQWGGNWSIRYKRTLHNLSRKHHQKHDWISPHSHIKYILCKTDAPATTSYVSCQPTSAETAAAYSQGWANPMSGLASKSPGKYI